MNGSQFWHKQNAWPRIFWPQKPQAAMPCLPLPGAACAVGFLRDPWLQSWAGSGRFWLMPGKGRLCQSSSCAHGAQISERKKEMGTSVAFLSFSGGSGVRALPAKGENPDIFIFEKETTSISFLCTKHLKSSQILDKRGRWGSAGSSQHRVCAHYIAQIIQRAALQVLTSQFKMFKYFTFPFRHCSLSASPLQSLLKACLKCHLPKLLFNEDSE